MFLLLSAVCILFCLLYWLKYYYLILTYVNAFNRFCKDVKKKKKAKSPVAKAAAAPAPTFKKGQKLMYIATGQTVTISEGICPVDWQLQYTVAPLD